MDNVFDAAQDGRTNPYYCESESERGPKVDLVANNLARYRWYGPNLGRAEERDLIRRAQAGDDQAKDSLIRHFSRTVLKIAGQYYAPTRWLTRDEMAAWGYVGLLEAIERFNPSYRNGLRAYAESRIRKFIRQATKGKSLDLHGELAAGDRSDGPRETRADRVLHSNPGLNAVQLAIRAGCSVAKAEEAISIFKANRYPEEYSTIETSADDDDATEGWDHGSDEPVRDENPALAFNCTGWGGGLHPAVRNDRALWAQLRHFSLYGRGSFRRNSRGVSRSSGKLYRNPARGAYFVDAALRAEELYARRRIKQIGRQGYADELVADDKRRIARAQESCLIANDGSAAAMQIRVSPPTKATPIPPAETAEKKAAIPAMFILLLAEKRSRDLKRVTPTPTTVRQTTKADKCPTFTNLLQLTRSQEKDCLPLAPQLPKPPVRSSQFA
jgi:DNA-directed RNA polymerase specialized sigma subunit